MSILDYYHNRISINDLKNKIKEYIKDKVKANYLQKRVEDKNFMFFVKGTLVFVIIIFLIILIRLLILK